MLKKNLNKRNKDILCGGVYSSTHQKASESCRELQGLGSGEFLKVQKLASHLRAFFPKHLTTRSQTLVFSFQKGEH